MTIFVRHRTRWASGFADWEYSLFPYEDASDDNLQDFAADLHYEMGMDVTLDGFRGVDVEFATPPKEWFDKQTQRLRNGISYREEQIATLMACRDELYTDD